MHKLKAITLPRTVFELFVAHFAEMEPIVPVTPWTAHIVKDAVKRIARSSSLEKLVSAYAANWQECDERPASSEHMLSSHLIKVVCRLLRLMWAQQWFTVDPTRATELLFNADEYDSSYDQLMLMWGGDSFDRHLTAGL